ncbi:MAG: protein-glutamate O-methyltransferase CheR [Verrucomicrobia bacterium]|nr:protein-glutamate O-methyltransferase CheR [Verrucomicrobiota bacterium]
MLTNPQFERMRRLASRLAGIELLDRHRELLAHRTLRLGLREEGRLDGLLAAAEGAEPGASRQLVSLLTTNFSGFFRHPRHFVVAAEHAVRAVERCGRARLWSAAAASGEEPYSLAMALIEAFGREEPPVGVLATDIDKEVLAAAQRGEYPERAVRLIEPGRRARFFQRTVGGGWSVAPAVRRLVEFRPLNLVHDAWGIGGPFEVIFCRNVLMYLETRHRDTVLQRLAALLVPEGLLLMDPAEHTAGARALFTSVASGVYSRVAGAVPGAAAVAQA